MPMRELTERVAVVTGGGSGIGAGIARALAGRGMKLVIADVDEEAAHRVAAELEAGGGRACAVRVDVARPEDLERLAETAWARFGGTHVLCNNAGVAQGGVLHELGPHDWRWLWSVNVEGVVNGCRAFVPRLLEQGGLAHVVNTASVGGFLSGPVLGMYSATKYAVVAYSEALRLELADCGIGVSVLCPGWTDTHLGRASRNRPAELGTAPDGLEIITPGMSEGLHPDAVGRHALRGIEEDALYVFTHPEFGPLLRERFDRVLAAVERAKQPPGP